MAKIKTKKIILFFLGISIILCLLMIPVSISQESAFADTGEWENNLASELVLENDSFNNSATNPYIISTPQELALLAHNVNNGEKYQNIYFKQISDINLAGNYFTPIGMDTASFAGIYDGQNFEIQNININEPDYSCVGLFGNVNKTTTYTDESGTIKNINITSGEIIGKIILAVLLELL